MRNSGPRTALITLATLLAVLPAVVCRADPAPVTSEYLHTFAGGFNYTRATHEWTFFIFVQPRKKGPDGGPLYLEGSFENPQPQAPNLIVKSSSLQAGKLGIKLETPPVTGMRDREKYKIVVRVYADKADTKLLGTHEQMVLYHNVRDPQAVLNGWSNP